jgi:hypothetical protein
MLRYSGHCPEARIKESTEIVVEALITSDICFGRFPHHSLTNGGLR